jgi:hypothetical protein
MTVTRRFQSGAELQSAAIELTTVGGAVASSTKYKTGSYSFRNSSGGAMFGPAITATAQFRVGFHLNHNSGTNGMRSIVKWLSGSTVVGGIGYNATTGLVHIVVGSAPASSVASISAVTIGLNATDTWKHIGVNVKLAASGGWVTLYVDGVNVLTFSGDTLGSSGVTTIDNIGWHGVFEVVAAWSNYAYYDDLLIDDLVGEVDGAVPDRRFLLITPNGNGTNSEMTGNDGNQVNNYQMADEVPNDGDTTYVAATSSGLTDTYAMTTVTPEAGWMFGAVIPLVVARKTAAEDDVQIAPTLRSGAEEENGSNHTLGTSYTLAWARWATDPSTDIAWDQSGVDAVEIGATSAGAYA